MIYNMGFMDHPVGELFEKVNDGQYHVVRFYRDGPNATIQVDQLPVQAKFPTGLFRLLLLLLLCYCVLLCISNIMTALSVRLYVTTQRKRRKVREYGRYIEKNRHLVGWFALVGFA